MLSVRPFNVHRNGLIILKQCGSCIVQTSQPFAGETDAQTGQVVHFCSAKCHTEWLGKNRRLPAGMLPV